MEVPNGGSTVDKTQNIEQDWKLMTAGGGTGLLD